VNKLRKSNESIVDNVGLAIALTLIFTVFAPVSETSAKLLGGTLPATQISFVRFAFHFVLIGLYIAVVIPHGDWRPRPLWPLLLRGALTTLGTICIYAGLAVLPMVDAVAIFFIQPLILTALSALVLGDHVSWFRWGAVCAGMIGALLIIGPNFNSIGWGALFPALAALLHGTSGMMVRRWSGLAPLPLFQIYTAMVGIAITTIILTGGWFMATPELTPIIPSLWEFTLLSLIGLVSMASTMTLTQALRLAPPSIISPLLYIHIVWSSIIGYIIFDYIPSFRTVTGATLVISAGLFVWWHETRHNKIQPSVTK
jgi:drug/metabolite transporter (DMT)-like permease